KRSGWCSALAHGKTGLTRYKAWLAWTPPECDGSDQASCLHPHTLTTQRTLTCGYARWYQASSGMSPAGSSFHTIASRPVARRLAWDCRVELRDFFAG